MVNFIIYWIVCILFMMSIWEDENSHTPIKEKIISIVFAPIIVPFACLFGVLFGMGFMSASEKLNFKIRLLCTGILIMLVWVVWLNFK